MKKIIFLLIIIVLPALSSKHKFEKEIITFHPQGGMLINYHNADFNQFQGLYDCGTFNSGSGYNTFVSLLVEKPISHKFHIGLNLGFADRSGTLDIDNHFYSRGSNDFTKTKVNTVNKLASDINFFEISPSFNYLISDDLITGPFRFKSSFRFYFANTTTFEQSEEIVSPDYAVFTGPQGTTQQRVLNQGEMESANKSGIGLSVGLENMIPVSENNFFTQEVGVDYNFTNVVSDASWNVYSVKLGLGFRFSLMEKTKPVKQPKPAPLPDPPIAKKPVLAETKPFRMDMRILSSSEDFEIEQGRELLATVPIVNSIFFDLNSSEIRDYYKMQIPGDINFFKVEAPDAQHYVLPRIAGILKKNPDASVILRSSLSEEEYNNSGLSRRRAENVRKALENLGVKNPIELNVLKQPKFPSNNEFEEGKAENRRVTIVVQDAYLQEYVDALNYQKLLGNVNVKLNVSNNDVSKVVLSNSLNDKRIITNESTDYQFEIDRRIDLKQKVVNIITKAQVKDKIKKDTLYLTVNELKKRNIDLNLENFQAILRFNYNSSKLTPTNKELLKQLVGILPENSTIEILGSADELGTVQRNRELEEERAENTREFIETSSNKQFIIQTGENTTKFDQNDPNGRFLNRSIIIKVSK